MGLNYCQMATENIEGFTDFNIDENWYKNRPQGLSAVIRCYGEERWIGACIESCLPLYDEIVVTLTQVEGDGTEDIVKSFKSSKIKIIKYPFKLKAQKKKKYSCDSVYQFSYYTNWGLSKTKYSHISARWDADHVLRPEYATKKFHDYVLSKSNIRVRGFNVVTPDFKYISKTDPYLSYHVRFAKANPYLCFVGNSDYATYYGLPQWFSPKHWLHFPVQQTQSIFNRLFIRDGRIEEPIFFHTKYLKVKENLLKVKGKYCVGENKYTEAGLEVGKKIDVNIPKCAFKKPDDYLNVL